VAARRVATGGAARPGLPRVPGEGTTSISSFSIGIIDLASVRCQAGGMTAYDATRRRYIDLLKTATALCS